MGYEIHIQRDSERLTLAEWQAAVERMDGVRLLYGDVTISNPATGEVITLPNSGGDAEVFLPEESKWPTVFHWRSHSGDVTFRVPPDSKVLDSPIRAAARRLAQSLGAQLVGDGGETYE